MEHFPARVTVDLETIASNTLRVKNIVGNDTEIMGIVKANAYGHGLLESAHAMLKGGATWLGVAKISEALELRKFLDEDTENCSHQDTRIFSWIYGPDAPYTEMVRADLDLSATTLWELDKFADAAQKLGAPDSGRIPRVHIEVDTGFSRNGFTDIGSDFKDALVKIKDYEEQGLMKFVGIWTHFANADTPSNPANVDKTKAQHTKFEEFCDVVENNGLHPQYKHIAASSAVLLYPEMHYNLVRPGIILYGNSPNPEEIKVADYGLKPAMKLEVQMNNVKQIRAGSGISYGHRYVAPNDTWLGIVPLGYADGVLRSSGGVNCSCENGDEEKVGAPVWVPADQDHANIVGAVCMDQFMVDLGPSTRSKAGDWVTLFGPGDNDPSIDEWAVAGDTISYEILTKTTQLAPISFLKPPHTVIGIPGLPLTEEALSQIASQKGQ
jgi:alanine racemase